MSNMDQNTNKPVNNPNANEAANTAKFHAQVKQKYGKLSDDDIKLYSGQRDQFFAKLQEKQNVSKADGEKAMQDMEKSCGCGSAKAA